MDAPDRILIAVDLNRDVSFHEERPEVFGLFEDRNELTRVGGMAATNLIPAPPALPHGCPSAVCRTALVEVVEAHDSIT